MGSNPRNSSIENSIASTLTSNSTNNGGNPSTSYNRHRRSLTASSGYRSQFAAKHHQANQQPGQDDDGYSTGDQTWPDNGTAVTTDGRLSAQFEQTMVVTDKGVEVLSARPGGKANTPHFMDQLAVMK